MLLRNFLHLPEAQIAGEIIKTITTIYNPIDNNYKNHEGSRHSAAQLRIFN